jgi:putative transposase
MNAVYAQSGISKQAHFQYVSNQEEVANKYGLYIGLIHQTRSIHPGVGLRQIWETTHPPLGRDAFIELGMMAGLGQKIPQSPIRTTFSVKSNRYSNLLATKRFTSINQIWVCDITYFQDKLGNTYYLFFLMDAYSRRIIGYCASDHMRATNAVEVLKMAMKLRMINDYEYQLIHHSDRGSQYISNIYTDLLESANIKISMCQSALENAHIERVNGTIKNQYLAYRPIDSLASLRYWLQKDVDAYNHQRPHSSLKGMTPVAFEEHLLTILVNQRTKMSIFTINDENKKNKIPNQLSLFSSI